MAREVTCRPLGRADFADAYALYTDLVGADRMAPRTLAEAQFHTLLDHPGTTVIGAERAGQVLAMATLHLLPNLTYAGRPYALVENVVTLRSHHGQGLGRAVMQVVIAQAWGQDAYKIMLLTGRGAGALGFYAKLGFDADEKHGMTLRRVPSRMPNRMPVR